jgi:hypothetical protein
MNRLSPNSLNKYYGHSKNDRETKNVLPQSWPDWEAAQIKRNRKSVDEKLNE